MDGSENSCHSLLVDADDDVVNLMRLSYGIFIILFIIKRILTVSDANKIIDKLNRASNEEEILDATVNDEDSIWRKIYIGDDNQITHNNDNTGLDELIKETRINFISFVQSCAANEITINENAFLQILLCLCYGSVNSNILRHRRYSKKMAIDLMLFIQGRIHDHALCLYYEYKEKKRPVSMLHIKTLTRELRLSEFDRFKDEPECNILKNFKDLSLTQNRDNDLLLTQNRDNKKKYIAVFLFLIALGIVLGVAAGLISFTNIILVINTITTKLVVAVVGIAIAISLLIAACIVGCKGRIIPKCEGFGKQNKLMYRPGLPAEKHMKPHIEI